MSTDDVRNEVRVLRIRDDVTFLIEKLFRATFDGPPPSEPVHYVAVARTGESFQVVGYYHATHAEEYVLVGGLCVDPEWRGHRIGERMEQMSFAHHEGAKAFFAHVGDPRRARRLGYIDTGVPHLVVRWMKDVDPAEQATLIRKVAALGPF
jgi:predicted N-acetyltransferase YhbS